MLPMSGLFDVIGMMDETVLRNMVRDSKIVTPKSKHRSLCGVVTFAILCHLIKIPLCYDD